MALGLPMASREYFLPLDFGHVTGFDQWASAMASSALEDWAQNEDVGSRIECSLHFGGQSS